MRGGTQYDILLCNLCKWGVEHSVIQLTCVDDVELVQMRGGILYNIHLLCNLCRWRRTDKGWNTVQYIVIQLVQMRLHLCKWGVEYSITMLICYATWANEVELVQKRGGTHAVQCHLLCNLYKWGVEHSIIFCATFANEIELVQMRGGTLYNIHYITCADEVDLCSGTRGATLSYHGNKEFQANNWYYNARWRWSRTQ